MKICLDPESRMRLLSRVLMFLNGKREHPTIDELELVATEADPERPAAKAVEFAIAVMTFEADGKFRVLLRNDNNHEIGILDLEGTALDQVISLSKEDKRAQVCKCYVEVQNFVELEFPRRSQAKPIPTHVCRYFNGKDFQESQVVPTVMQTQPELGQRALATA